MLELIKAKLGIESEISVYDDEIKNLISDCLLDLADSGVIASLIPSVTDTTADARVLTAIALYVSAYIGNDRTDTEEYEKLYRKKVSRITLVEASDVV